MTEEEYQILEGLFMTRWPDNKRGNSLMKKCEALYDLAKQADGGCIVELGTFHGCGAVSLAFGARAGNHRPVYTVDDYVKKRGWAGESYFPQDKARFLDCVKYAGVQDRIMLIQESVDEAADGWMRPISLLFWDLGMRDRLANDFLVWGEFVIPGGTLAVREGGDKVFGSEAVFLAAAVGGRWALGRQFPAGHVYTMVKNE